MQNLKTTVISRSDGSWGEYGIREDRGRPLHRLRAVSKSHRFFFGCRFYRQSEGTLLCQHFLNASRSRPHTSHQSPHRLKTTANRSFTAPAHRLTCNATLHHLQPQAQGSGEPSILPASVPYRPRNQLFGTVICNPISELLGTVISCLQLGQGKTLEAFTILFFTNIPHLLQGQMT